MNNQVGLWIDHREAYVVFADELNAVAEDIKSGMEKHVRFARSEEGKAEDFSPYGWARIMGFVEGNNQALDSFIQILKEEV